MGQACEPALARAQHPREVSPTHTGRGVRRGGGEVSSPAYTNRNIFVHGIDDSTRENSTMQSAKVTHNSNLLNDHRINRHLICFMSCTRCCICYTKYRQTDSQYTAASYK